MLMLAKSLSKPVSCPIIRGPGDFGRRCVGLSRSGRYRAMLKVHICVSQPSASTRFGGGGYHGKISTFRRDKALSIELIFEYSAR